MTKIIQPKKQSNIFKRPSSETGIWSWITTVDHKKNWNNVWNNRFYMVSDWWN